MSRKRTRLSFKEKLEVIAEREKCYISTRKLAVKFGIGKSQVSDIIRSKDELKKICETAGYTNRKRKFPETGGLLIDQLVYDWICDAENKNVALSGPLLKKKALEVSKGLNFSKFKASNGWLQSFCKRHEINLRTSKSTTSIQESTTKQIKTEPVDYETYNCDPDISNLSVTVEEGTMDIKTEIAEFDGREDNFTDGSSVIVNLPESTEIEPTKPGTRDCIEDSLNAQESVFEENQVDNAENDRLQSGRRTSSSSLRNMSQVCEKLRDVQNFFLINKYGDLAVDVHQILMKCESEAVKIKN